jgi:signal transduction histidine kinase
MTDKAGGSGGGSIARRLALWIALCTGSSLLVFAVIAYLVVRDELAEQDDDSPAQMAIEVQAEVGHALLVAGPVVLVLALAGTVALTRRVLRPLDRVVAAAAAITARDLERRLPLPGATDELRTVVLAFNQLLERLQAGFDALGRFATEASHELRTPLTVIGTELEVMLQRPRAPGEWENSARACLDEVRHLTRLVEALLEMSRAEGEDRAELADLDEVVAHVLSSVSARAAQRGISVSVTRDAVGAAAKVRGSHSALTSAVLNIVDNAIRYTAAGSEVTLTSVCTAEATLLHVDDAGPGIEGAELEKVFEPFTRGRAGRSADARAPGEQLGVGLGLAISRKILDLHGARVAIERSPAGGARFSIAFARG